MDIIQPIPTPQTLGLNGIDPQVIGAYLLKSLMLHFSDARYIRAQALKDKLWDPDLMKSRILICTRDNWAPSTANQRPALVVRRMPAGLAQPMAIGDKFHQPTNLLGNGTNPNYVANAGQNQQLVAFEGAHAVACVAGTDAATDVLATEVYYFLTDFMHIMRQDLHLVALRPGPLPVPEQLNDFKPNWAVPLVVNWRYERSTVLASESPILKGLLVQS